ncbi:hypothetical protein BIV57_16980 [Mangrovactinospora gilvigrisea]|uniref:Pentapeptide repeat-containing protein n=1 Tax=Mangrovactinospora gilvigrisea TaxID=1428644 RepID=A0A1J7C440_9ACTN|nr:hypothetical protein BIV57_16980 [Mangrovactinospora gilvigrisea]
MVEALEDLPYAEYLAEWDGRPLRPDGDYDTVRFDGADLGDQEFAGARFLECAFSCVQFGAGRGRHARFAEAWLDGVRMVGTDLVEAALEDITALRCVLAGVPAHGSVLSRVHFRGCKLDSVNLRQAVLREVVFEDCVLRDVDWGGAKLREVSFPGSTLERVTGGRATLVDVDFRDAASLGFTDGHESLVGGVISTPQLMDVAPALAAGLGIEVRDER